MLSDEDIIELRKELAFEKWNAGDLRYKLHPGQALIYNTIKRVDRLNRKRLLECARGFGKSYLAVIMAIEDCLTGESHYPVRIIGPELKQTVEIVSPIISVVASDAPEGLVHRLKAENKWQIGNNTLILGGFNRDYIDKLRGQRAKSIYLEEPRDVPSESLKYGLESVLQPMSLNSFAPITMLTTTPAELDHYLITHVAPDAQKSDAYFNFTIFDNPNATDEMIHLAIRECGGIKSEAFQREYMCRRIKDANVLVVPEFSESFVKDIPLPEQMELVVVGDMGGVRDNTCILFCCYDPFLGKKRVLEELFFPRSTQTRDIVTAYEEVKKKLLEEIRNRCDPESYEASFDHRFILDAPGQLLVDLNAMHGVSASLPLKDDFFSGINAIKVAFYNNEWVISPRCRMLIQTLQHQRFNKQRTDYERTDTLGHGDALAAFIYADRMIKRSSIRMPKSNRDNVLDLKKRSEEDDIYSAFFGRRAKR